VLSLPQSIAHDFRDIGFPKLLSLLDCIKQQSRKLRSAKSFVSLPFSYLIPYVNGQKNQRIGPKSQDRPSREAYRMPAVPHMV
jgi:hypothetical protein